MRVANGSLVWAPDASDYDADNNGVNDISGDISNAALYSNPVSLRHLNQFSIQCVLAGATVTGSLKLQCSNSNPDYAGRAFPTATSMNWTDVDGSSQAFTAAGNVTWNAQGVGYLWVRVVWTESGTAAGTITGTFNGKGDD
jgi:hypothetical protein